MLAGNPSQWPLIFCFGDETGVAKTFHVGCVIERVNRAEKAERELAEAEKIITALTNYSDSDAARWLEHRRETNSQNSVDTRNRVA